MALQQMICRRRKPTFLALPVIKPGLAVFDALTGDGFFAPGKNALPLALSKTGPGSLRPPLPAEALPMTGCLAMGFALCHALWNIFVVGIGVVDGGSHPAVRGKGVSLRPLAQIQSVILGLDQPGDPGCVALVEREERMGLVKDVLSRAVDHRAVLVLAVGVLRTHHANFSSPMSPVRWGMAVLKSVP